MKHQGDRAKALMLIALIVFLPVYVSAPAAAAQEVGQISGVVTDGYDYLVPNANIHLYSLDRVLQTKSDAKGRFRLNSVPAGTYELEVTASAFKTKTIDQVKVSGGSSLNFEVPLKFTTIDCPPLDSISYDPSPGPLRAIEARFSTYTRRTVIQTGLSDEGTRVRSPLVGLPCSKQSGLFCAANCFKAAMRVKLFQNIRNVIVDRLLADRS